MPAIGYSTSYLHVDVDTCSTRHVHESSNRIGERSKKKEKCDTARSSRGLFQQYNATLIDQAFLLSAADFASHSLASRKGRRRPATHTARLPPHAGDFQLGMRIASLALKMPMYRLFLERRI